MIQFVPGSSSGLSAYRLVVYPAPAKVSGLITFDTRALLLQHLRATLPSFDPNRIPPDEPSSSQVVFAAFMDLTEAQVLELCTPRL